MWCLDETQWKVEKIPLNAGVLNYPINNHISVSTNKITANKCIFSRPFYLFQTCATNIIVYRRYNSAFDDLF